MLELIRVAVTGGVASGKSTVCRFFKDLGAYTVNADDIVHKILDEMPPPPLSSLAWIEDCRIDSDGKIDRKKVANLIFAAPDKRRALEAWLHPEVKEVLIRAIVEAKNLGYSLFVAEIPLLFEAGFEKEFDYTIAVVAPDVLRKKRCPLSPRDFSERDEIQMTQEMKASKANFIIQNKDSLDTLQKQVKKIADELRTPYSKEI